MNVRTAPLVGEAAELDTGNFEQMFREHYQRTARVLVRIVHDPARAEELASEVFWKFLRRAPVDDRNPAGWLYRTATRLGLDELRRRRRQEKYAPLLKIFGAGRTAPSPEHAHAVSQEQQQVRSVLAFMKDRDASLLILRSEGMSYQEIAEVLAVNETSVGTLLRRAQDVFRKEYEKRHGTRNS